MTGNQFQPLTLWYVCMHERHNTTKKDILHGQTAVILDTRQLLEIKPTNSSRACPGSISAAAIINRELSIPGRDELGRLPEVKIYSTGHAHENSRINPLPILVPRGRAPFGQYQESRPLARSNTGSPRFTDFPSLCTCSESSLTNLIGSGLNLLYLQSHLKPECR